jgi:hypothetical protein
MKAAILIHSDPKSGTEEALGRVFNALAVAHDLKQKNEEVRVMFIGTGTRWLAELSKADHPVHGLFEGVKDKIDGASSACAAAFGATEDVENAGFELLTGNDLPGTTGLPSVADLMTEGYQVLVY